jgi:UDP-2-acetamido-2,6-beta-L-arabino-hexul-4-ose reductase
MKKIVVTGAAGLIGWHTSVRLHAANCAARFNRQIEPFELVALDHASFDDDERLHKALLGVTGVLHFAGVNRAPDKVVETANPEIAKRLAGACRVLDVRPHIVYANSTHAIEDTPYGRSKRVAGEILSQIGGLYTNLVLPHIFGECARPHYNNVSATFIDTIIAAKVPDIDPNGRVSLLHAGTAAKVGIDAITHGHIGTLRPESRDVPVNELFSRLQEFHTQYSANVFPDLSDTFDLTLFNSYRAALYPCGFPRPLKKNIDPRGTLFEAVKGGGGGQTFLSTTKPGIMRGDHFHLNKVERFLVLQGEAIIRIRKVLRDEICEYRVSGDTPTIVDIPTLHTHSIENIGDGELLTLFWTHEQFDPSNPDTYADKVVK